MMLFIQAVGVVALSLDVLSVQRRHRGQILGMQVAASVSWVAHFLLLGATAGAAMNAVGIIRSIAFYLTNGKHRPAWVLWSIIVLSIVATYFTWQGYVSLLPMIAMIIAAVAIWQKNEQAIRILLIMVVPLWFVYNFMFMSYAGMASDLLALVSLLTALYRYRHHGVGMVHPIKANRTQKSR